jgi:putative ABC transport system permease protein
MQGILINEAMVSHMGWKSNEEALGKRFNSLSGKEKVIGIFKNFNANSLHEKAGPMVLNMKEDQWQINYFTDYIAIRYFPGSLKTTLKKIEKIWNYYCPQRPFKIHEEEIRKLYYEEDVLSKFTAVLSLLIVIVAALGLYGLASFTAEQRTKETGIRKVLGSSVLNIISLITRDFIILTGVSCLIALPLSFLVLKNWLSGFAYHINFSWPVFIISSLSAIALTFLITGLKAYTTARINPVETLKYE